MKSLFNRFTNDESGATAIEYALIAALMAVAIITGIGFIAPSLQNSFQNIAARLVVAPAASN
jgi:pilus assembly protein Flp/PilA